MSEDRVVAPLVATPGTLNILGANQLVGKIKFAGGNAIGPQLQVQLNNVMFRPANVAHGLIQDEWGFLQVTGECLVDSAGIFGTITHPDTTLVSPLTSQYYIGKGVVSIALAGAVAWTDIGNVPVFEFTPNVTVLSHYTSRLGIRSKDLEVIHEKQASLNIHMDELTYTNLILGFMGTTGVAPPVGP
jgi:hypothetical protein